MLSAGLHRAEFRIKEETIEFDIVYLISFCDLLLNRFIFVLKKEHLCFAKKETLGERWTPPAYYTFVPFQIKRPFMRLVIMH